MLLIEEKVPLSYWLLNLLNRTRTFGGPALLVSAIYRWHQNYSEFRNFPVDDYVVAIDLGVQDKG